MSQSWMQGYTSDIEYTTGYYREQEPTFLNLSATMHGVEPVPIDKTFTYCELGCGKGHTALIMAANYPQGKFIAVDFNPTHISQARRTAEEAGLDNIEFLELSFEDLSNDHSLLPLCDFITFHGIYALVSDTNREFLAKICKQHLKSGGLVYNSYNAQPGWAAAAPLQKTLNLLSQQYSGNSLQRFGSALNFINNFKELKPRYFEFNSTTLEPRLNSFKQADPSYLVHEYLNEGWQALYFPDVAQQMSKAKLDYIGLANPAEAYSYTIIPDKLKEQLSQLEDFPTREMIKDLAYNTSFRKDLYSRGGKRINAQRQLELLHSMSWVLTSPKNQSEFTFNLSVGEATGDKKTYQKVIDALSKKPLTTKALEKETKIPTSNLIQTLIFLYSSNKITLKHKLKKTNNVKNLNKVLALNSTNTPKPLAIAAGKIGTSLLLNPIELSFLNHYLENAHKDAKTNSIADMMFKELSEKGLSLTISGKTHDGDKMKKTLQEMEKSWNKETLPRLQEMGCV